MILGIHGSGAMALYYGFILEKNHCVIWHTESQEREGVQKVYISEKTIKKVQLHHIQENINSFDAILVFRKSYQLNSNTYLKLLNSLPKDLLLIVVANGMGYQEQIIQHHQNTLFGITNAGVTFQGNRLNTFGKETLYFPQGNHSQNLEKIFFKNNIHFIKDFDQIQSTKLIVNCCINPITALLQCTNGELLNHQTKQIFKSIIHECISIGALKTLSGNDLMQNVIEVCQHTAKNKSSMFQDVYNNRETEINYMNGYISNLGDQFDVSTPVNKKLTQLIKKKAKIENIFDLYQKLQLR
jgi:2-dehydropantoate 2-reductase